MYGYYDQKHFAKVATRRKRRLSRMSTVKQLFHAFINRSVAYDYPNQIGLMLFGSEVSLVCPLTPLFEQFREHVDDVQESGDTKLYDALDQGCDVLERWRAEHSTTARLRIICLSDGEDTKSKKAAHKVAAKLQTAGVVVDAINIGPSFDPALKGIVKATGGLVFEPASLRGALQLNELETMLSSLERPAAAPVPRVRNARSLEALSYYPMDRCDDSKVPPRKEEKALLKAVVPLRESLAQMSNVTFTGDRKRLMLELRNLARHPHSQMTVFPCEQDISFWKLLIEGPDGTPYANGCWLCFIKFSDGYPATPPEIRFVTPIKHCNINCYGKVCHSILDRNYSPDTTVLTILQCVYGLLLSPDVADPLDSTLALAFYDDSGLYETSIVAHTKQHAARSVHWWKMELGDDDLPPTDVKFCLQCGEAPERMKRCSRCKTARYCSTKCQRAHWKRHRHVCNIASTPALLPVPQ
jgi:ubiquitin-protein ligase